MKIKKIVWQTLSVILLFSIPKAFAFAGPDVKSSYTVTLPASMTLESDVTTTGYNMGSNYEAKVKGTINEGEYVIVTPYERSGLVIRDGGGNIAPSKIVQAEICWGNEEINEESECGKSGSVYADINKPGRYSGDAEFSFYISDKYIKTDYHSHNYIKTLTKQVTCTEDGEYSFMCRCGDVLHTESIPHTGHIYEHLVINPTCSTDGYTSHTCNICGSSYTSDVIKTKGHVYSDIKYIWQDDVCIASRSCNVCEVKEEECVKYEISVIKKENCGSEGEILYTATFKNPEFETQIKSIVKEKWPSHTFVETVVEPTESSEGYTLHECSVCGYSFRDNIIEPIVIVRAPGIYDSDWNLLSTTELTKELVMEKRTRAKNLPKAMGIADAGLVCHVILPEGVTSIGTLAFYNCYNIDSITIPEGCSVINNGAFMGCENLSNVEMPDSVRSIGVSAFNGCYALESIRLSNRLLSIGTDAFSETGLRDITIPASVSDIGAIAFAMNDLETVIFEDPEGWYVINDDTDEIEVEEIDLSDPNMNAKYLCDMYCVGYSWSK